MNLFTANNLTYKITKPIRLIELFAGIGAQAKALENIGATFEHYKICEFDKYAVCSYNAIHNTNFTTSDITKIHSEDLEIVDTDKYEYILTYSFPCTDLSLAGKRKGMEKGSKTHSSLLWEVERLLEEIKDKNQELPQILLMENVPEVIGEKNFKNFKIWCDFLSNLGYVSNYDILVATDYGIPQTRRRCFMVSILKQGGESPIYEFPDKQTLKKKLKDFLEESVDKKYFISPKMKELLVSKKGEYDRQKMFINGQKIIEEGYSPTITTKCGSRPSDPFLITNAEKLCNDLLENNKVKEYDTIPIDFATMINNGGNRASVGQNNIVQTLTLCGGGAVVIPIKNNTKQGYLLEEDGDGVYISNMQTKRGTVQKGKIQTLKTSLDIGVVVKNINELAIRRLTPKECYRLMGFNDIDFENAKRSLNNTFFNGKDKSDSHLIKQAGNSIVVQVLEAIFKELL